MVERDDGPAHAQDLSPSAWNLDPRNPRFTGREHLLTEIAQTLDTTRHGVVQAINGIGGIGKTQLVLEFAHREAAAYDVVWWCNAETIELRGAQYHALGLTLGLIRPDASQTAAFAVLKSWLHSRSRWLLIFDNAEDPELLRPWIPSGSGHVLITSRHPRWGEMAEPIFVDVLDRAESVELLKRHSLQMTEGDASTLAGTLGDLPLALVQAAGFLEESGTTVVDYAQLLEAQRRELLDSGRPITYPRSLAATIRVACDNLAEADPDAVELLRICAFMAPESIPSRLLLKGFHSNPQVPVDAIRGQRSIRRIVDLALARMGHNGLYIHRLTRAIIQDETPRESIPEVLQTVQRLLVLSRPGNGAHPENWSAWQIIVPHIIAVSEAKNLTWEFQSIVCDCGFYLIMRGEVRLAEGWFEDLTEAWASRLGSDHEDVLHANHVLALARRHRGKLEQAKLLNEDTLERRRRVLGSDAVGTLATANNLGKDLLELGHFERAYEVHADIYERRRRLFGEDDLETLNSAHNLASALRELGRADEALRLDQKTLAARIRIFGLDHPHSLYSIDNVARDLLKLNKASEAVESFREAYSGRISILGEEHPDTLESGSGLARALYSSGDTFAAQNLNDVILNRRRKVLGEKHPATLRSERNLAAGKP